MILHCIDVLKGGLDSLKKMMRYKDYNVGVAKQHLDEVLESFEEIVSQPLPQLPEHKEDKYAEPDKQIGEPDHEVFMHPKKGEKDGGKPKGSSSTSKKSKIAEKDSGKAKSDSKDTTALPEKVIQVTELDKHIRKLRAQELDALHIDCKLMPIHQMMIKIEEYIERLKKMAKVHTSRPEYKMSYQYVATCIDQLW